MQKRQNHQPQLRLLPDYFKKIGIGVILLTILCIIYLGNFNKELLEKNSSTAALIFIDILIIGFLLIAFAKDKIEDELLILIRLQSMAFAFVFSVLFLVITHLKAYVISNYVVDAQGQHVILTSLLVYHFIFIIKKKRR